MQFNADAVPDAMSAIADAMTPHNAPTLPSLASGGGKGARQTGRELSAPEAVAALVATLPVPHRLRDAGVPEAILDSVAAEAATNSTIQANPKPVTEADLRALLQKAW
jgi:alcohol dehydrogenase